MRALNRLRAETSLPNFQNQRFLLRNVLSWNENFASGQTPVGRDSNKLTLTLNIKFIKNTGSASNWNEELPNRSLHFLAFITYGKSYLSTFAVVPLFSVWVLNSTLIRTASFRGSPWITNQLYSHFFYYSFMFQIFMRFLKNVSLDQTPELAFRSWWVNYENKTPFA